MTPEWTARLALMAAGFHADMAALDAGRPLPPPLARAEIPTTSGFQRISFKEEIAAILDMADHPMIAAEIFAEISRNSNRARVNRSSVYSVISHDFLDCRIDIGGQGTRNSPQFAYTKAGAR